jgi:hypothetical protein
VPPAQHPCQHLYLLVALRKTLGRQALFARKDRDLCRAKAEVFRIIHGIALIVMTLQIQFISHVRLFCCLQIWNLPGCVCRSFSGADALNA